MSADDYLTSGFAVMGIVGIDGSPSCGVVKTLDPQKSFDLTAHINVALVTVDEMSEIIRQCLVDGNGLFTASLQAELKRRRRNVPYTAHDLMAEIREKPSQIGLFA